MARKDPFRTVAVRRRILEALEPLRVKASEGELRAYSVNSFCEKILWDYAKGELTRRSDREIPVFRATEKEFGSKEQSVSLDPHKKAERHSSK